MIAKQFPKVKNRLSKTTITAFKSLARRGSDAQIEDFLFRVCQEYIAEVRDTDYVDPNDYLKVSDTEFECICPNCNEKLKLYLKELIE